MGKKVFLRGVTFYFFYLIIVTCSCSRLATYDVAILNGILIGGDGNPWYKADIGLKGERIAAIGKIPASAAREVIQAEGLHICPGFIDIHTHADRAIDEIPTADNYLLQGVTTVVGGNCGGHPYPLSELFRKIKKQGTAVNFCCLIGHNTIRREVMELKRADPTPEEMRRMKALIDQEMRAGGVGFSTGLSYMPGTYSKTEELIELAGAVAQYGGFYASHIRNQAEHITEAIEEAIRIGEENGIRVQISHVKLASDPVWGKLGMITEPVERARRRGLEVTLDQYPYTATSSGFTSSLPSWCLEGGQEEFLKRLEDSDNYGRIKEYVILRRLSSSRGINKLKTIYIADYEEDPSFEGKNLEEILKSQGKEATVENGADLIIGIEKKGGASGVFFQMDEEDVEKIMSLDYNMIGSDGAIIEFGKGVPHCRSYGTFPRVIHNYVLRERILSLEEAVRKMTSLPAQTLRLVDRGLIKKNMCADLVIFDLDTIKDEATYQKPHQYPSGIKYVFVNGEIAARNGKPTGKLGGEVLYGPGKK